MGTVEYLETELGKISYEDTGGDGKLILCVPGMGDLREVYRFVGPALHAQGYRVVSMDIRGMGKSSASWPDYSESAIASDMAALIRKLDNGPGVIIGNSISAGAAVCAAADNPELVSSLVLIGPFARQVTVSRMMVMLFRLAIGGPWGASTWVNYQAGKLYPTIKPDDIAEYSTSVKRNLQEGGRMSGFRKMAKTDHRLSESKLSEVSVPALIVMGTKDPDFPDPAAEAELLSERLRGEFKLIEGAGHYPQAEMPKVFLDTVMPFLKR